MAIRMWFAGHCRLNKTVAVHVQVGSPPHFVTLQTMCGSFGSHPETAELVALTSLRLCGHWNACMCYLDKNSLLFKFKTATHLPTEIGLLQNVFHLCVRNALFLSSLLHFLRTVAHNKLQSLPTEITPTLDDWHDEIPQSTVCCPGDIRQTGTKV